MVDTSAADATRFINVLNPSNGQRVLTLECSSSRHVDESIRRASRAFETWRGLSPLVRARHIHDVAAIIADHLDEIADLESRDSGRPVRDARALDVAPCIAAISHLATSTSHQHHRTSDLGAHREVVLGEPLGVVGVILSLEWPALAFASNVMRAIVAGNTVVVNPADGAPLTVMRLVELAAEVLPAGVVTAVTGPTARRTMVDHPAIGHLTFSGPPEAAQSVRAQAATTLTPCTIAPTGQLELFVLSDADLDVALPLVQDATFLNRSPARISARVFVHDRLYDEFLARLDTAVGSLRIGHASSPSTAIGPVASAEDQERAASQIQRMLDHGNALVVQTPLPVELELGGGNWVAPTILSVDSGPSASPYPPLPGPVAIVERCVSDSRAVELAAQASPWSTTALFSHDQELVELFARRARSRSLVVNDSLMSNVRDARFAAVWGAPLAGVGDAGSLTEFSRRKTVHFPPIGHSAARAFTASADTGTARVF